MNELQSEIREIISTKIHLVKCSIKPELTQKQWGVLDTSKLADEIFKKIQKLLELWAFIPCCHMTGMHDPVHFEERKYICESQKAKAFERLCKDLNINPETKSEMDCGWCGTYLHYRKGEGLKLF